MSSKMRWILAWVHRFDSKSKLPFRNGDDVMPGWNETCASITLVKVRSKANDGGDPPSVFACSSLALSK